MSANGQLAPSELGNIPGGRLRKDAAAAFNAMYHEHRVTVRDSYRPLGRQGDYHRGAWSQWAAWERYQAGGNTAAKPGTSNHGWGLAIDLASPADRAVVDRIGAKYGFSKSWSDAPDEWWHITYQPGHYRPKPPAPQRVWKFGSSGWGLLGLTRQLQICGWLKRPYFRFNSQVHGAVVAFQGHHHLVTDGTIGPATERAIRASAAACKRTRRKEH